MLGYQKQVEQKCHTLPELLRFSTPPTELLYLTETVVATKGMRLAMIYTDLTEICTALMEFFWNVLFGTYSDMQFGLCFLIRVSGSHKFVIG